MINFIKKVIARLKGIFGGGKNKDEFRQRDEFERVSERIRKAFTREEIETALESFSTKYANLLGLHGIPYEFDRNENRYIVKRDLFAYVDAPQSEDYESLHQMRVNIEDKLGLVRRIRNTIELRVSKDRGRIIWNGLLLILFSIIFLLDMFFWFLVVHEYASNNEFLSLWINQAIILIGIGGTLGIFHKLYERFQVVRYIVFVLSVLLSIIILVNLSQLRMDFLQIFSNTGDGITMDMPDVSVNVEAISQGEFSYTRTVLLLAFMLYFLVIMLLGHAKSIWYALKMIHAMDPPSVEKLERTIRNYERNLTSQLEEIENRLREMETKYSFNLNEFSRKLAMLVDLANRRLDSINRR